MAILTQVYILYNPVSTGSSYTTAKELFDKLTSIDHLQVELLKTDYAGHAGDFAREHATEAETLLIASSGDGTYHEIVNAALSNSTLESRAVCGLLPSGNANDHYHFVHEGNTVERIRLGDVRLIDALKISFGPHTYYGHSYAGIGITPQIGHELNQTKLNRINELWLVIRNLFRIRSVRIIIDGGRRRYDSLVFSTNGRMSKVLKLSKTAEIDDGLFEISALHSTSGPRLLQYLLKASTVGIETAPQAKSFSFITTHSTRMQIDGEIIRLPAHTEITIASVQQSLRCIV